MASLSDAERTDGRSHLRRAGTCGTLGYQCPEGRWVISVELPREVLAGYRDSGAITLVISGH